MWCNLRKVATVHFEVLNAISKAEKRFLAKRNVFSKEGLGTLLLLLYLTDRPTGLVLSIVAVLDGPQVLIGHSKT